LQQKCVRPITLLFEVGFYNYLTERIVNGKKQELMIIKELFEGQVGDYCIARNTLLYCPQYYQMLVNVRNCLNETSRCDKNVCNT